ncbi:hypothetical protein [Streptomyces californicus]|uniref:hypothetical protein n=1 Tax=Streptomyces californicus TaxID=67351 RepID=UPI003328E008
MTLPDFQVFASGVAERLPGGWTSTYQRHATYEAQFPTTNQLWDSGHVRHVGSTYVLPHDAVLHGPDSMRLYVTGRPLYPHQYVVAPLEPTGNGIRPHHLDDVAEPDGITVPGDPIRAAAAVTRRLLPRYTHALLSVLQNVEDQPEPPRRPAPSQAAQVLTLAYYDDGAVGAPYESVPPGARTVLFAHGFQYHPHQEAVLLSAAWGEVAQARRMQAMTQRLIAQGIGVDLRPSRPQTMSPPTALPSPVALSPLGRAASRSS